MESLSLHFVCLPIQFSDFWIFDCTSSYCLASFYWPFPSNCQVPVCLGASRAVVLSKLLTVHGFLFLSGPVSCMFSCDEQKDTCCFASSWVAISTAVSLSISHWSARWDFNDILFHFNFCSLVQQIWVRPSPPSLCSSYQTQQRVVLSQVVQRMITHIQGQIWTLFQTFSFQPQNKRVSLKEQPPSLGCLFGLFQNTKAGIAQASVHSGTTVNSVQMVLILLAMTL